MYVFLPLQNCSTAQHYTLEVEAKDYSESQLLMTVRRQTHPLCIKPVLFHFVGHCYLHLDAICKDEGEICSLWNLCSLKHSNLSFCFFYHKFHLSSQAALWFFIRFPKNSSRCYPGWALKALFVISVQCVMITHSLCSVYIEMQSMYLHSHGCNKIVASGCDIEHMEK